MRTTVDLAPDVAKAVSELRRRSSMGLSEAVNELARAGLAARAPSTHFHQRSASLGLRVDVSNVAEVLEVLEQADRD